MVHRVALVSITFWYSSAPTMLSAPYSGLEGDLADLIAKV
jgi:hypothetical protein